MRLATFAALIVGVALPGMAQADLEEGDYAPDIEAEEWMNTDEPVSLSELRGMTVAVFFWVSWHEGGEAVMPLMLLLNSKLGRSRGVYMMGLTDASRERVEDMLKEQKAFFPVGLESKSYLDYKIQSFPRVVVIDPDGKVAWSGWPGSGDELFNKVTDLMEKTPPTKTHPDDAIVVQQHLRDARRILRDDKYLPAYDAARNAHRLALTGDALKTQCLETLELVEALGRDKLAQARKAALLGEYEKAVALIHEIRRDFKGLDVALTARRTLDNFAEQYDEVARILERRDEAHDAERILAAAMEDLRSNPRRIGEAYVKLEEIISDHSDSPAAAKAQTVLDRMKDNAAIMGHVRDYKATSACRTLFRQARAYEHTGEINKAKEIYRSIMREYADTIYFDQAAEALAKLP